MTQEGSRYDSDMTRVLAQVDVESSPTVVSSNWVESCWKSMQSRCRAGETFSADEYLSELEEPSEEVAVDLIYGEYVTRLQAEEVVDTQRFVARYPDYADALRRQLALETAISSLDTAESAGSLTHEALPFAEIGRYRLITKLGSGAQANVYRAHDHELHRDVAIKLEHESAVASQAALTRSEAIIGANLQHASLAPVIDVGQVNGQRYVVSRYVDAVTFSQWVKIHRPTDAGIAKVVQAVAEAIAYAHERGILHLDIKPANVLVDNSGHPFVVDFGLASISRSDQDIGNQPNSIRGTLPFMSPEQANGNSAEFSAATDIFGIGALLYSAICTGAPYEGLNSSELAAIRAGQWDREKLRTATGSDRLKKIIVKSMAANPAERFQSAADLGAHLQQFAESVSSRRQFVAIGLAGIVAASLTGVAWLQSTKQPTTGVEAPSKFPQTLQVMLQAEGGAFVSIGRAGVNPKTADKIKIVGEVPEDCEAVLFSIAPTGSLQILDQYNRGVGREQFSFPREKDKCLPLVGVAGTEIIGLAVGNDCDIVVEEIKGISASAILGPPPTLVSSYRQGYDATVSVAADATDPTSPRVATFSQLTADSRALGTPVVADPHAAAMKGYIGRFINKLNCRGIKVEIVAFPHSKP